MSWIRLRLAIAAIAVPLLAACSANHYSVFRHRPISGDDASITVIDAKQRAILSAAKAGTPGSSGNVQRFCAEPSPDVFAVVAQALSAGGSFGKSADPKTIEAALTAAFSSSEQGSTIPRTQTVNMLRELMFRTCERYLNGGIGSLELPLQAIRDQRLMVSILAIEQLTGAVTPKPVVIGVSGEAAAGASGAEAAVRVDNAYKDLQAKTAAEQKRQNEFNEINTESKDCDQIADAVAKSKEDSLSDALKAKQAKCESATSALAKAKSERAESAAYYATISEVASSDGIPASARTTLMQPGSEGGIDQADNKAISDVAEAVREIVKLNFDQDEFRFLCLKVLSPELGTDQRQLSSITNACIEYLNSDLGLRTQENLRLTMEKMASQAHYDATVGTLFASFWKKVSSNGVTADANLVAPLRSKAMPWPACFLENGTRADYKSCFESRTSQEQRDLAQ
ncbi:MAG TPA: hypothetical protein VM619_16305 [Luteimonas sp.]|nr:hypothetical protein [Luteimonas sp.]